MAEAAVEVAVQAQEEKPVEVVLDDKAPPKAEAKVVTADEGIDDLRAQVERARRESAERLAAKDRMIQEAHQRAVAAERETIVAKRDHVGTIMEKLTADKDAAKRDLRAAHEAGDFDRVAEAQDRLSMANARIVEAEKGKLALDEEVKQPIQRQIERQDQSDPVESYARSIEGANPRSADWIRRHPEVVVNGSISPRALSAHYAALDEGLRPDSDAYLERLDAALGASRAAPRREERQERQNGGRDVSRAPVSAPVGRDAAQAPGQQRPGVVRLSPDEVRAAIDTIGPLYPDKSREELCKIYVQNRQLLVSEGRLDR